MIAVTGAGCLLMIATGGCGPSQRGADGVGTGPDSGDGESNVGADGGGDNCSDAAKLVYTVDTNNTFSKFDPSTKMFTDLGTLSCPAGPLAQPFSMAIDRYAIAWVVYSDAELFRVDIQNNLACTKTSWTAQHGLTKFGMGFSSNPGGTSDTLYVAGKTAPETSTLAMLDTTSMTATTWGTLQGRPELTGTGSGQLWGWFPDVSAPRIAQIDKMSGSVTQTYTMSSLAGNPADWAFAFWGGDFWIFLMKGAETSTTVYQVDGMTGAVKGSTPTSAREIVGAGVSTCAPVVIQ
jgi:hypothetical protein